MECINDIELFRVLVFFLSNHKKEFSNTLTLMLLLLLRDSGQVFRNKHDLAPDPIRSFSLAMDYPD